MNFLNSISNFSRNFFATISSIASFFQKTQLGDDIDGELSVDNSGYSVATNAVGDRIVIGAILNDGNGADSGSVRVYSWDGVTWSLMAELDGEAAGDNFGNSVAMNALGDRIVVGAPFNDAGGASTNDRGHVRVYSHTGITYTQLGVDINGTTGDNFGFSVSMNAAGDRIVVGAIYNDVGGTDTGAVRAYYWSGSAWTQLGSIITGTSSDLYFGWSVSMNDVGDRIAIGSYSNVVRVYSWDGTSWTKLGSDITKASGTFGYSVSINAVGDKVAIGAPFDDNNGLNSGTVRIYSWDGATWAQLGADINGEAADDRSGQSVSINAAGDKVTIGARYNDAGQLSTDNRGHVRTYFWDGTAWTLMVEIDGEAAGDNSGNSVAMNDVGDRVVIGALLNDGTSGSNRGHTRVYSIEDLRSKTWTQLGLDIYGEGADDSSGFSVSINNAGDRIAIGAPFNDGISGTDRGHVRIYEWDGSSWTQLGVDIDGEASGDNSGISVSLNAAGDRVAVGAYRNDGTSGSNRGHVRIYSWNGTSWTQLGVDIDGVLSTAGSDNNFGYSVSMNAVGDRVAIGAIGNDTSNTDSGQVRIYSWNGISWTQLGVDINGDAAGDAFGYSVSMNALGDKVVISAISGDGDGIQRGVNKVYSWNGTSWIQLGLTIQGNADYDAFGRAVSINDVGDKIVIGGNGSVRAYFWNGISWNQLGADLDGASTFGWSVSMNGVGDKIAVGTTLDGFTGSVSVYSFDSNASLWTKIDATIYGDQYNEQTGYSVSMNAAGDRVVIGARFTDQLTDDNKGRVRVYKLA